MIYLIAGSVLLLATVVLYVWVLPRDGQPSRLPNKWGLVTMLPVFITCLGVAGLVLIAKSFVS